MDELSYSQIIDTGNAIMPNSVFSRPDFTRAAELTPEVESAIDDAFEYHPWNPDQVNAGKHVRKALAEAVKTIVEYVPPGPDRTTAIRKLREARMRPSISTDACGSRPV